MTAASICRSPNRPTILGTRHMVAAGHYLAAQAGLQILEAGGNAVDAGVGAGLVLGVVESEYVGVAGVAPILIRMAETGEMATIDGLGTWPQSASCEYFRKHHGGEVPQGILRTVVPGAPDAWITALELFGTFSFRDTAAAAIRMARDGFPMYPMMAELLEAGRGAYEHWPSSAAIYLPGGRAPEVGTLFIQSDLGAMLQYMADEEQAAATKGRADGLQAARDAFYRGDIAAKIVRFQEENGGLLSADDLARYRATVEKPLHVRFGDVDVFGCGPWCQGPMMLQALSVLDGVDLAALGHNSTDYVHTVAETIKLSAADRHAYYGDPKFVDVPMETLLSDAYAQTRRKQIRPDRAWPDMPPAGEIAGRSPSASGAAESGAPPKFPALDTSYVCVVDAAGNAFSGTPSDGSMAAPVVPGIGIVPSSRGAQSWVDPDHPSSIAPGKRPRLTPNPALAMREGDFVMPFGTPGHDVQTQVMLQVFLNMFVFDMEPQTAIEAPRFVSYSFPSSSMPHESHPGLLHLEPPIPEDVFAALGERGHDVEWWPTEGSFYHQSLNCVCVVHADVRTGIKRGAADSRRPAYAVGW